MILSCGLRKMKRSGAYASLMKTPTDRRLCCMRVPTRKNSPVTWRITTWMTKTMTRMTTNNATRQ